MQLTHRIQNITPPATLALSAKAKEMQANGVDVLNLTVGEPDFDTPAHIRQAAIDAINRNEADSYTASAGIAPLKAAIAKQVNQKHQTDFTAANVVVTTGGKFALYALMQALLQEGDAAIIPAPGWVSYAEQVKLAGATPLYATPDPAADTLKVTPKELEAAWTPQVKVLILNTPVNPTGEVYTADELMAIGEWAVAKDLTIVADDMYGDLVYNGAKAASFLDLTPVIRQHTVLVNGFSKSYAMTGWRVGYLVADEALVKPVSAFVGQSTSNLTAVSQYAALAALEGSQDCVEEMRQGYEERLNTILPLIEAIPGVEVGGHPQGAFYLFLKVADAAAQTGYATTDDFVAALLDEAHVAVVPGRAFGMDGYVRISYGTSKEILAAALGRIKKFVEEHQA